MNYARFKGNRLQFINKSPPPRPGTTLLHDSSDTDLGAPLREMRALIETVHHERKRKAERLHASEKSREYMGITVTALPGLYRWWLQLVF